MRRHHPGLNSMCFVWCALLLAAPVFGVEVTRFGAVPDDDKDDTAAFVAAFKHVEEKALTRIVIPPGRYRLRSDGNPDRRDTLLPVTKVNHLAIEGRGAELIMSGASRVFAFSDCRNVSISGLTIDWERPPFSEGTVVATAPRHFDVRILDNYPVKGGEPVGAFMSYHPDTRLPDGRDLDVYNSVQRTELIAPQVLRVHLNREIPVPEGKLLVLRHKVYGGNVFNFHRCADVAVNDVTIYCAPGMGLTCGVTANVTLKNFNVLLRPGSGRLMSATADATHFSGCKGTIRIEDCTFEGMGDDGVNVKSGLYLIVRKRLDDRTVLGQHNLKLVDLPDVGDTMEMMHVDALTAFASGKVRQAKMEPGDGNLHRVEFEDPLPAALQEGDVLGNASRVPILRMRNCTVRANRARGVLCQTRDAIIEDCVFEHCTSAGVLVLTEVVYFFESIGTRNVTVRNNRFESCNLGAASAEGALCALAYLKDFAYPRVPGVHRDVVFERNQITNTRESAIFAAAVDGLTLRNNAAEQACLEPSRPNGRHVTHVQDCARVVVEGNSMKPERQGQAATQAIHITPSE